MAFKRQTPTPGHPVSRGPKAYIWVTWLAQALGGSPCLFSHWFKAHYQYVKFEQDASNLSAWNRDHTALMREQRAELEDAGWQVAVEDQNEFKIEGELAVVAGKPDIVATQPGHTLIVDGKTGKERESDWWQVFIYLYAWRTKLKDAVGDLRGIVAYKKGDRRVELRARDLTPERVGAMVQAIKVIGGPDAPLKSPSKRDCRFCNIGYADCPEKFREANEPAPAMTEAF